MTDYVVYVHEIQPDHSTKEIHSIALVENERPNGKGPLIYNLLVKTPDGIEDSTKLIFRPSNSNDILGTVSRAFHALSGESE